MKRWDSGSVHNGNAASRGATTTTSARRTAKNWEVMVVTVLRLHRPMIPMGLRSNALTALSWAAATPVGGRRMVRATSMLRVVITRGGVVDANGLLGQNGARAHGGS